MNARDNRNGDLLTEISRLQAQVTELEVKLEYAKAEYWKAVRFNANWQDKYETERQRREDAEKALRDYRTNGTWFLGRTPPDVIHFSRYLDAGKP